MNKMNDITGLGGAPEHPASHVEPALEAGDGAPPPVPQGPATNTQPQNPLATQNPPAAQNPPTAENASAAQNGSVGDAPADGKEQGYFKLWPANEKGLPIRYAAGATPDLADEHAVEIYMGPNPNGPPTVPTDQAALQADLDKVLRTIQLLYKPSETNATVADKKAFRNYYVRLFSLGQLGLEGKEVATSVASDALKRLTADLIDDHAGRIKNGHLRTLGMQACKLSLWFLAVFIALRVWPDLATSFFQWFDVDRMILSNFMLLWAGCFLGVWLSYGVRTTSFTLRDLTITDSDRLTPFIRLVFAGFLTMILGLLFVLGLVEVKIGTYPITNIAHNATLAFAIGVFCGLSELVLPNAVAKRASDFIGKIT